MSDFDFTKPKTKLEGVHTLSAATFAGSTETPEDELRIADAGAQLRDTFDLDRAGFLRTPDRKHIPEIRHA